MRTLLILTLAGAALAQQADPKLSFEVASVKPAGEFDPRVGFNTQGGPGTSDPGRINYPRITLSGLLAQAYDARPDQILGPEWLTDFNSHVYAVNATMAPGTTKEQFRVMLQNLLAERFHVVVRHEMQNRPGYELVVAPGGPKLTEWKAPADGTAASGATASMRFSTSGRPAPIRMSLRLSMPAFCRSLGSNINISTGAPMNAAQPRVVDKTGLTGIYEFKLEFQGTMRMAGLAPSPSGGGDTAAPSAADPIDGAPGLFTALEKQLGLKLVKVKDVPVDVWIVEKADQVPTEN